MRAAMGEPAETRSLPSGERVLWYPRPIADNAYGSESYAATIAPDGKLVSLEQRLAPEYIARLIPDQSSADDVRNLIGPPGRAYAMAGKEGEVWEYALQGFQRPVTLYVQVSPDAVVREVYLLERRGEGSRSQGRR